MRVVTLYKRAKLGASRSSRRVSTVNMRMMVIGIVRVTMVVCLCSGRIYNVAPELIVRVSAMNNGRDS